jgi:drug/metabolite transporter (DMT)-like permease
MMSSAWLLFAILASILISASSIFEKKTLLKQHALEFAATMSIYTFILTIPFWLFAQPEALSLKATGLIYLGSLLGAIGLLLIAKAMRHIAISIISPFLVFEPMFVAIFAALLLGERITGLQLLGMIILVIGAYVLNSHEHDNLLDPFKHVLKSKFMKFIFLGLVVVGLDSIVDKRVLGTVADGGLGVPVLTFLPLIHFFLAINFVVIMLIFSDGFEGLAKGIKTGGWWVFTVAVLTLGYRLAIQYAISLPGVLISLIVPIKRLSSLFSTIIGGELFHEKYILRKSIACAIMIIGAIILVL